MVFVCQNTTDTEAKPLKHNQFSLLVGKADSGGNKGQLEWKWNLGHERAPPSGKRSHRPCLGHKKPETDVQSCKISSFYSK